MSFIKKPYCKVCHDAGKNESEYSNHYVKSLPDRNGKTIVTCPTLLSINCRYCNQNGHTLKFCMELKNNQKNNQKNNNHLKFVETNKEGNTIKTTKIFPSTIWRTFTQPPVKKDETIMNLEIFF